VDVFDGLRRKIGLWLLPDGEADTVRVAEIVTFRNDLQQYGERYLEAGLSDAAAQCRLIARDLENRYDIDE
jgi:hypothetical protein